MTAQAIATDSSSESTVPAILSEAQLILNSDRHPTAKLRALASFYDIPWRNARDPGKHLLNQQIKQALSAYPNVYQALSSQ